MSTREPRPLTPDKHPDRRDHYSWNGQSFWLLYGGNSIQISLSSVSNSFYVDVYAEGQEADDSHDSQLLAMPVDPAPTCAADLDPIPSDQPKKEPR